MKAWVLLLLALAPACTSSKATPAPREELPTPTEPVPPPDMAVLFERMYDGAARAAPMFGPDGDVIVGARRWDRNGRYLGMHAWAISGQVHPLAIIGEPEQPIVIAAGWSGLDAMPAPSTGGGDGMWLLAAPPTATKHAHAAWTSHEFLDFDVAVAPNRAALAMVEGKEVVVRAVPTGTVIARTALGASDGEAVACWTDDARIAWIGREGETRVLRTFGVRDGATRSTQLATPMALVACDPAGGAAGVTLDAGAVGILDLATGVLLAAVVPDLDEVELAVGDRGGRLAVSSREGLAVYQRVDGKLVPLFARARHDKLAPQMAFSPDGQRLAVAGASLVVLGPKADARVLPAAPQLRFELPAGFTAVTGDADPAWAYAQLSPPSKFASLPALLVAAENDQTEVIGIALDREELAPLPSSDASDSELAQFGKRAMAQLFGNWVHADLDKSERDAGYTLRVGRTDGKPWFEARELRREGCEPYDGYTRVVIDRDAVFVIRALTIPHGPIDGWLAKFFDLPFGVRVQTALRRGPSMGPC